MAAQAPDPNDPKVQAFTRDFTLLMPALFKYMAEVAKYKHERLPIYDKEWRDNIIRQIDTIYVEKLQLDKIKEGKAMTILINGKSYQYGIDTLTKNEISSKKFITLFNSLLDNGNNDQKKFYKDMLAHHLNTLTKFWESLYNPNLNLPLIDLFKIADDNPDHSRAIMNVSDDGYFVSVINDEDENEQGWPQISFTLEPV